jgi:hypothetical protein
VAVEPTQQLLAVRAEDVQQLGLRDEQLIVGQRRVPALAASARRDVEVPRVEVGEVDLRDEQRRSSAVVERLG